MTRDEATKQAKAEARKSGVTMVVAFNPYDDPEIPDAERYGFYPATATRIFFHEKVVETITA